MPTVIAGGSFGLTGTTASLTIGTIVDDQTNLLDLVTTVTNLQGLVIQSLTLDELTGEVTAVIDASSFSTTEAVTLSGIYLVATDTGGLTSSDTFTVIPGAGNSNPVATGVNVTSLTLSTGRAQTVVIGNVTDSEDDGDLSVVTAAITVNNTSAIISNVVVNSAGVIRASVFVPFGQDGVVLGPITLRVADSGSLTDTATFTVEAAAAVEPDPTSVVDWTIYE